MNNKQQQHQHSYKSPVLGNDNKSEESYSLNPEKLRELKDLNDQLNFLKINLGDLTLVIQKVEQEQERLGQEIDKQTLRVKTVFEDLGKSVGLNVGDGRSYNINWNDSKLEVSAASSSSNTINKQTWG